MTAHHEGVFRLHDIEITYRAGPRTRHVRAAMDQCILALDPAHKAVAEAAINRAMENDAPPTTDPLVAEYVSCARP